MFLSTKVSDIKTQQIIIDLKFYAAILKISPKYQFNASKNGNSIQRVKYYDV